MARRANAGGSRMPQVETGLRRHWKRLADTFTGLKTPVIDALDAGKPVTLTGTQLWAALYAVSPREAEDYRRSSGQALEADTWTYDPRTQSVHPG